MREEERKVQHERIAWLDVARFFGIFAIYLGHFANNAGRAYPFVFSHHVALFFLISGCMENFNKEKSILKYTKKKIKNLMVPFWIFAILAIIFQVIINESDYAEIKKW